MKKILSFCLMMLLAIQVAFAEGKTTPSTSDSGNLSVETGGGNNKATDETQTRDGGSNDGDKKIITSQKYVDDELAKKQNKIGTQSGTYAVTYTNTAGTVSPRQVKTSLGTGTSDSALPTVSAVNAGLNLKQTKVPAKDVNTVVTYTGTEGVIGEKGIYQDDATYAGQMDNLIEAGAFNAAVKTGLDSEFLCAGNSSGGDCWLWSIHNETDPELPPEYTRLEYIQTTGTQWIDTGIRGHMGYTYEIDFQQTATGNFRTWGVFNQSSYVGQNMSFTYCSTWCSRWESVAGAQNLVNLPAIDTNRHTLRIANGNVYFDNVSKGISPGHNPTFAFNYNLFLGTINPGNATPSTSTKAKFYSYKVWDTSGMLIQNLIPAKHGNDVGMYDAVSGTFKTNAGSGVFTEGPAVTDNMPFTTLVPDGYTPVEYLESSGTQYIDTDWYPDFSKNFRVTGTAIYAGSGRVVLFGSYPGVNKNLNLEFGSSAGSNGFRVYVGTTGGTSLIDRKLGEFNVGDEVHFDVSFDALTKNITTVVISNGNVVNNTTTLALSGTLKSSLSSRMFLDLRTPNSTIANPTKIHNITIYEDGAELHNYLSVQDLSNNSYGMYDTVTGQFFPNNGSGTFTAGPDISNVVYIPQGD